MLSNLQMKKSLSKATNRKDAGMAIIKGWQRSGLSQRKFCEQNHIAYHSFHYWYKRFRDQKPSASFVPVHIQPPVTGSVELILPDGKRVLFYQPVSSDYLKALLA